MHTKPVTTRRAIAAVLMTVLVHAAPGASRHVEIHDYQAVRLEAPRAGGSMALPFNLSGREVELRLEDNGAPFDRLDPTQRARIFAGGNRFLRGTISGMNGSWIRLSWIDGRWSGANFNGRELFLLESAESIPELAVQEKRADTQLLFRLSDLEFPQIKLLPPSPPSSPASNHGQAKGTPHGGIFSMPVTIVSDTQFSDRFGAITSAVVAGRINFVDGIYISEFGVGVSLHYHEILTDNGPLTSTDVVELVREQFRPFMTTGSGSGIPFEGLAHLFTDRTFDAGAGYAYINVLCDENFGFGADMNIPGFETLSSLVVAHELGHNFGAPHDTEAGSPCEQEAGGRIMTPTLNQKTLHEFSDCSKQHMATPIAGASCLTDSALFRDRFEQSGQ